MGENIHLLGKLPYTVHPNSSKYMPEESTKYIVLCREQPPGSCMKRLFEEGTCFQQPQGSRSTEAEQRTQHPAVMTGTTQYFGSSFQGILCSLKLTCGIFCGLKCYEKDGGACHRQIPQRHRPIRSHLSISLLPACPWCSGLIVRTSFPDLVPAPTLPCYEGGPTQKVYRMKRKWKNWVDWTGNGNWREGILFRKKKKII